MSLANPLVGDSFGSSVDISGKVAIVAAPGRVVDEVNDIVGAAYILERDINKNLNLQWSVSQELANPGESGDGFGGSLNHHRVVGIDGSLAVVGAPFAQVGEVLGAGKVHVYFLDSGIWLHETFLTAPDPEQGENFGQAVAISGTRVIVGAPQYGAGEAFGRAFIFNRTASGWEHEATLTASNQAALDEFGFSAWISGSMAIVGAPGGEFAAVYRRTAGPAWIQDGGDLVPSNGGGRFGHAVRISGTTVLVGAPTYNDSTGIAYLYGRLFGEWSETTQLSSDQGMDSDQAGRTLGLDGGEVFVGVFGDDASENPDQNGSVLIFFNGNMQCAY